MQEKAMPRKIYKPSDNFGLVKKSIYFYLSEIVSELANQTIFKKSLKI